MNIKGLTTVANKTIHFLYDIKDFKYLSLI